MNYSNMKYIKLFENTTEIPNAILDITTEIDLMKYKIVDYLSEVLKPFNIESYYNGDFIIIKLEDVDNIVYNETYEGGVIWYQTSNGDELLLKEIIELLIDDYTDYFIKDIY